MGPSSEASLSTGLAGNSQQADVTSDSAAVLSTVIKRTASLLQCSRLLVLLSDPLKNNFSLLQSSVNATAEDEAALNDKAVTATLAKILDDQGLSIEQIPSFPGLGFVQPLIYQAKDNSGTPTSALPVGLMLGFKDSELDIEDLNMVSVFALQIAQLTAVADFLPKIQNSVSNYKTAVKSLPIGLTFLDKDGRIFDLNSTMGVFRITDAAKGMLYQEAFTKESAFLIPLVEKALKKGEASSQQLTVPVEVESEITTKVLKIQVHPTLQAAGDTAEIAGVNIAVFDITQTQADESLTNSVMATVSHDLRTPLTVISGNASFLIEELKNYGALDPEIGIEFLQSIFDQSKRMGRLVSDLLDAERIAGGMQLSLVKAPFDLVQSVTEVAKAQQSFSHASTLSVVSEIPELEVIADRDRIEQVVANYLSNAVKYSPKGGTVTVEIKLEQDTVRVSVKDEGIGIPPEQMEKLFGRLFRVESEKHEGIKGTGLGLFLCKNLIDLHGGEVTVESVYGEGSTFSFTLPLKN